MPYQHLCLTRQLVAILMDISSRNQCSSQIGWLFGDSLENGNCDGDLEEDLSDGMVIEN